MTTPARPVEAKRALTKAERLDLLRETLAALAAEGYARARVEVTERGAIMVEIDKARSPKSEISL